MWHPAAQPTLSCALNVPPCSKSMNVTNGSTSPAFYGTDGVNSSPPFIFYDGFASPKVLPFPTTDTPVDGARIPSVMLQRPSANRDHVHAQGQWRNGVWTVELERKLVTDDPNDAQFPIQ